ncbi:MAG: amidohydrolase, partial [Cyclobacteriaceae bacterium]|nr:amidohydrolase [Cyclobacteriaceae bacterium]
MIYNYFKQVFLLSLVAAFSFSCNEKKTTVSGDILIKNIAILSPSSDSFSSPQYVLISGDSILGISSDSSAFSSTVIIDGQGKFLIPGLSEMHAHIPTPAQGGMELVEETLFLYLSQGVTTIRGMLGDPFHLELKEKIKKDEILSPRIITSG